MSYSGQISARQRWVAASSTLLVVAAVGMALLRGLDLSVVRIADAAISAISIPAPQPREEPPLKPRFDEVASGKAGEPNEKAKAAPIAAPEPKLPPVKPTVPAAPAPGTGSDASAGAAAEPGAGSGAGGRGEGSGAGGSGSGTGGGTRPVWVSGTIRDKDYPRPAARAKVGGEVEVRFTIEPSGQVSGCRVSRSSGDPLLDATTCRLIEERFRFKPATNGRGVPVASQYGWRQSWWLERSR
ncbi:energy transducer TonB [Sphingopyxis flava]|uniref:Protein TonB n=1 Tax=Sphingopyxis flava TaxID=1507287 RepID=A0A1T5CCG8_9SPHN|nr:energy transducer TonB [Sphingopyxis flava]SKB57036.1 protein TonB [Sphingopyxis flava]